MNEKEVCRYAYRKPGCDTVHCTIQTKQAKKWDFCAHQYLCNQTRRYEITSDAKTCALPKKAERKLIDEADAALDEAERVFSEAFQPKFNIRQTR